MQRPRSAATLLRPRGRRRAGLVATSALVVLVALLSSCSLFEEDDGTPSPTSMAPPPEIDIPYGDVAGCPGSDAECGGSQQLDIYRSDEPGPNPVLLWVHGGGFIGGDKEGSLSEYFEPLLDDGWDIVAANHRLTTQDGQNPFPTGLLDLKRAVRWIKANAPAQDWDPSTVGAIGHSAGGNLVELLATTAGDPELEPVDLPPELQTVDSSVFAAVALAPVSDLVTFVDQPMFTEAVQRYVECTTRCTGQLEAASVQTHVGPDAAPILAIHGANDPWAPPAHGQLMQDAYTAAGIGDRFQLIVVDDGPEEFRAHMPDMERWIDPVTEFLDEWAPPET